MFLAGVISFSLLQGQNTDAKQIKTLIQTETRAFADRDFTKWKEFYFHDSTVQFCVSTPLLAERLSGWDEVSSAIQSWMHHHPKLDKRNIQNSMMKTQVIGKMAWVSYQQEIDGENKTWEQRILRKENGQWKFISVTKIDNNRHLKDAAVYRSIFFKYKAGTSPEAIDRVKDQFETLKNGEKGITDAIWMESDDKADHFTHALLLKFASEASLKAFEKDPDYIFLVLKAKNIIEEVSMSTYGGE